MVQFGLPTNPLMQAIQKAQQQKPVTPTPTQTPTPTKTLPTKTLPTNQLQTIINKTISNQPSAPKPVVSTPTSSATISEGAKILQQQLSSGYVPKTGDVQTAPNAPITNVSPSQQPIAPSTVSYKTVYSQLQQSQIQNLQNTPFPTLQKYEVDKQIKDIKSYEQQGYTLRKTPEWFSVTPPSVPSSVDIAYANWQKSPIGTKMAVSQQVRNDMSNPAGIFSAIKGYSALIQGKQYSEKQEFQDYIYPFLLKQQEYTKSPISYLTYGYFGTVSGTIGTSAGLKMGLSKLSYYAPTVAKFVTSGLGGATIGMTAGGGVQSYKTGGLSGLSKYALETGSAFALAGVGFKFGEKYQPSITSWEKTPTSQPARIPTEPNLEYRGFSRRGTIDIETIEPIGKQTKTQLNWEQTKRMLKSPIENKSPITETSYQKSLKSLLIEGYKETPKRPFKLFQVGELTQTGEVYNKPEWGQLGKSLSQRGTAISELNATAKGFGYLSGLASLSGVATKSLQLSDSSFDQKQIQSNIQNVRQISRQNEDTIQINTDINKQDIITIPQQIHHYIQEQQQEQKSILIVPPTFPQISKLETPFIPILPPKPNEKKEQLYLKRAKRGRTSQKFIREFLVPSLIKTKKSKNNFYKFRKATI